MKNADLIQMCESLATKLKMLAPRDTELSVLAEYRNNSAVPPRELDEAGLVAHQLLQALAATFVWPPPSLRPSQQYPRHPARVRESENSVFKVTTTEREEVLVVAADVGVAVEMFHREEIEYKRPPGELNGFVCSVEMLRLPLYEAAALTTTQSRAPYQTPPPPPIAPAPGAVRWAASSLLVRPDDDAILCVWDRRLEGWVLPGGLVEPGESVHEAQSRELEEETGLHTARAETVYQGPAAQRDRATSVVVFRVWWVGELPREVESGGYARWLSREQLLQCTPYREVYQKVFAQHDAQLGSKAKP